MDVFFIPLEDMQNGDNVLTLQAIAPENPDPNHPTGGIIYDYLRWEQGDFPGRENFIVPDDGSRPLAP